MSAFGPKADITQQLNRADKDPLPAHRSKRLRCLLLSLTFRALQFSRLAMLSAPAVESAMTSPSQRRPRTIAATLIIAVGCVETKKGRRFPRPPISSSRRSGNLVLDQSTAVRRAPDLMLANPLCCLSTAPRYSDDGT